MDASNAVELNQKQIRIQKTENLNIRLFLGAKLISLFGTRIYSFALALYILKITGSGTSFALSILMGTVPGIVLSPFAGMVADRIDRKKMTIFLDIVSGLAVFALLFVSSIYGLKIVFIYATTFTLSVVNTFYDIALQSSMPNLVTDKLLTRINSYSMSVSSTASILCPIIGGAVYGIVPINIFLVINALSFFVSSFAEVFIDFNLNKKQPEVPQAPAKMGIKSTIEDIREVFNFLKDKKALMAVLKYAFLINFFGNAVGAAAPFILNNIVKVESYQYGIINGAASVGMLVTSIILGKLPEKEKKKGSLVLGIFMFGIITAAYGIPTLNGLRGIGLFVWFIYFILISVVEGVFGVIINVPFGVMLQRLTPDNLRGRVNGVFGTLVMGITPIAVILSGILIDTIPAYILTSVCGIALIIASYLMFRNKALDEY
jgi:MFS family permease